MLNFCDFIQVYVFSTNHHLNRQNPNGALCLHMPVHSIGNKLVILLRGCTG